MELQMEKMQDENYKKEEKAKMFKESCNKLRSLLFAEIYRGVAVRLIFRRSTAENRRKALR